MPKKRAKRGGNGYFSTSEIKLTETKKSSIDILFCEIETSIVLGYPKPIFFPVYITKLRHIRYISNHKSTIPITGSMA